MGKLEGKLKLGQVKLLMLDDKLKLCKVKL